MGKSRFWLLSNALIYAGLLGLAPADAVEQWVAGGSGFAWEDVGALTGLTTDESTLLPAVVDSTTTAVENLPLVRNRPGLTVSSLSAEHTVFDVDNAALGEPLELGERVGFPGLSPFRHLSRGLRCRRLKPIFQRETRARSDCCALSWIR